MFTLLQNKHVQVSELE